MKQLIQRLTFHQKLLVSFVTLSFLPVLLTGMAAYHLYTNFIFHTTEESSIETIDMVCYDIDDFFYDTWSLCSMLTGDIKIQKYLRKTYSSISEQYSDDLAGSMDLASISTYRKDIFGVYVFGKNGGRYKSNYYSLKSEDQRNSSWFQTIISNQEASWFPPHKGSFVVKSSVTDNFITVGLPVIDKASGRISGIVAADMKEDAIAQKIQHSLSNGVIYILDPDGSILFCSTTGSNRDYSVQLSPELIENILSSTQNETEKSTLISDPDYLIVGRALRNSDWRIAGVIDKGFLTQSSRSITKIVILLLLIIAFSSLYVAMKISNSVYKPVQTLCQMMEAVESGDFSVRYAETYTDEFGRLGRNFNQMLNQTQNLISQIYEEQKKLKNSELKALQAQIQPHFLYNSLDSVIWLLRMNKNGDAEKMMTELSTLFKISLSRGNEIISLRDELQHVSSYLFITSMIYSKKIEYRTECDPSLYSFRTLKLLLQPLAENTIVHAKPLPGQKIYIYIRIYEDSDSLILSVQDISAGISPEALKALQRQLASGLRSDRQDSGYGLYNVNERLRILFGNQYGLTISSEEGFGTEVSLKIPKLKGDDDFVSGNLM